ncbi:MAG: SCO family protein [Halobacteriales archaeon]
MSALGGGNENVVLPPQEDQLGDSEDIAYPAYGEEFPEFSLPNPLTDETVESTSDSRVTVATAIYATCPDECVATGNQLAGVQSALDERGLTDAARFLLVTFDPERDTEEVLRDYAERMDVDTDAGNWRFGRPEGPDEAERIVTDRLGIEFQREGGEFIHPSVTFLVNPDGYVERAYQEERPAVDRVSGDVETVADSHSL